MQVRHLRILAPNPSKPQRSSIKKNKSTRKYCIKITVSIFKTFLTIVVPYSALIVVLGNMVLLNKQALEEAEEANNEICPKILQIASLISSLSAERVKAVQYITSRSGEAQYHQKLLLHSVYQTTDINIYNLSAYWPLFFKQNNSTMFRTPQLFQAILGAHRSTIIPGKSYFKDEVLYYAEIIENFIAWLNVEIRNCIGSLFNHRQSLNFFLDKFLLLSISSDVLVSTLENVILGDKSITMLYEMLKSLAILMSSAASLGAEQSFCTAFHAVSCLSHRETFDYANFSFSAEYIFRIYRKTFPSPKTRNIFKNRVYSWITGNIGDIWANADHKSFFPELNYCRQEILAELDHTGPQNNPSICNRSNANENEQDRLREVQSVIGQEINMLSEEMQTILSACVYIKFWRFQTTFIIFIISFLYLFIICLSGCSSNLKNMYYKRRITALVRKD